MSKPRYFISVFGKPDPPDKDLIESGIYHPEPKYAPFSPDPGDILLVYCTAGYISHSMVSPGIGIVLGKDSRKIHYRWVPFADAVPRSVIDQRFDPDDLKKLGNIRFSSQWLFEISRDSFSKTVRDRAIQWAEM